MMSGFTLRSSVVPSELPVFLVTEIKLPSVSIDASKPFATTMLFLEVWNPLDLSKKGLPSNGSSFEELSFPSLVG